MLARTSAIAAILVGCRGAVAQVEIERFEGGLTNPFFAHAFEYDDSCCWSIVTDPLGDNQALKLHPNFDVITMDVPEGVRIVSVTASIYDYEGGFVGDRPTSTVVLRSSSGDFVYFNASAIAEWTTVHGDVGTPGLLTGEPLGDIVRVELQAANEGNSLVPGVGALFDDLVVAMEPRCAADIDGDGDADSDDFFGYLDLFVAGDDRADLDDDGDLDSDDFFLFLDAFAQGC